MSIYRANINIRSLDADGCIYEFCKYYYKDDNMTRSEFEKYVNDNLNKIADDACYEASYRAGSVDLIGVLDFEFEELDDD